MQRVVQITKDGSQTISIPEMNVTYHSIHGAIQESRHVFIEAGLNYLLRSGNADLKIFEVGFGTGLNALLTLQQAMHLKQQVSYYAIDPFPLEREIALTLEYPARIDPSLLSLYCLLHEVEWEKEENLNQFFTIHKARRSLLEFKTEEKFHLIYFDAFAPSAQSELWTEAVFRKMFDILLPNGVLVTYCSKGDVRRAMVSAGFFVEKLQGPPGKREMLRASKKV